jgi:hypothetical protein
MAASVPTNKRRRSDINNAKVGLTYPWTLIGALTVKKMPEENELKLEQYLEQGFP